ncbi:MAG: cold shock domain-containing protein [Burkholderiaceae bacterium]
MAIEKVKGFNNLKGFGFLEPPEISSYIFAHFSEINMDGFKRLEQGSVVSYD